MIKLFVTVCLMLTLDQDLCAEDHATGQPCPAEDTGQAANACPSPLHCNGIESWARTLEEKTPKDKQGSATWVRVTWGIRQGANGVDRGLHGRQSVGNSRLRLTLFTACTNHGGAPRVVSFSCETK